MKVELETTKSKLKQMNTVGRKDASTMTSMIPTKQPNSEVVTRLEKKLELYKKRETKFIKVLKILQARGL